MVEQPRTSGLVSAGLSTQTQGQVHHHHQQHRQDPGPAWQGVSQDQIGNLFILHLVCCGFYKIKIYVNGYFRSAQKSVVSGVLELILQLV